MAMNNIRVAVRVRPPLENEMKSNNTYQKLQVDSAQKLVK